MTKRLIILVLTIVFVLGLAAAPAAAQGASGCTENPDEFVACIYGFVGDTRS